MNHHTSVKQKTNIQWMILLTSVAVLNIIMDLMHNLMTRTIHPTFVEAQKQIQLTRLLSISSLGEASDSCKRFLGEERRTTRPLVGDLLIGVLSVRLMGLSMGIGDHSIGSDLLPRPLMTSSSGEGVRERYEEGKLTVADQVRLLSIFPVILKISPMYSLLYHVKLKLTIDISFYRIKSYDLCHVWSQNDCGKI